MRVLERTHHAFDMPRIVELRNLEALLLTMGPLKCRCVPVPHYTGDSFF